MGKKKHKKKQKKAAEAEDAGPATASSLQRIGQALLDQARSPLGRQVIAAGLVVAASALARDSAGPGPDKRNDRRDGDVPAPVEPGPSPSGSTPSAATASDRRRDLPDAAALAGLALSALDRFIHRKAPADKP